MSAALSISPFSGFRLSGDRFRVGEFYESAVVHNDDGYWLCEVYANQTVDNCNCFLKNPQAGLFDLSFDGPVYLDVYAWNGSQFVRGGYLEERQFVYTFGGTPIAFKALGLRPAQYYGGLIIEGLHTHDYWDVNYQGVTGTIRFNVSQPFVLAGRAQSLVNWSATNYRESASYGEKEPALSANISGIVADDIRWHVQPYEPPPPTARSIEASPTRAAPAPAHGGFSSFRRMEATR